MEILHICTQAPGKTSGGEIGILQFSYALSKIADRVDYVGPQIKDPEIAGMYNKAEYLENTLTPMQKVWSLLHFQFDRKYISWKKKSIDFSRYDYIFIEFTKLDYVLRDILKSGYKGKILVRAHNVEKDYLRISYESDKNFVNFIKHVLSGRREGYMVHHADAVLAITETDKNRLIELYGSPEEKIVICPVGVNEPKYDKSFDGKIGEKLNCLITGSLWFGPNADATAWFIISVFPQVKNICNLTVAGFKPNDTVKQLCFQQGVNLIDSPESMQPYFEQADMVLAPIFEGGGMKVKIAEAMSYGLTVVTTDHGNIGYNLKNHENGFIANTADEFAEAIRDYYCMSEKQRCEFLDRVWKVYCERFSLIAIKNICEEIIHELFA